jgi:hypothetical protein
MYSAMVGDGARRHWIWAVLFALGLELAMLLTPYPAVFGIHVTAGFIFAAVLAHAIFGLSLGLCATPGVSNAVGQGAVDAMKEKTETPPFCRDVSARICSEFYDRREPRSSPTSPMTARTAPPISIHIARSVGFPVKNFEISDWVD